MYRKPSSIEESSSCVTLISGRVTMFCHLEGISPTICQPVVYSLGLPGINSAPTLGESRCWIGGFLSHWGYPQSSSKFQWYFPWNKPSSYWVPSLTPPLTPPSHCPERCRARPEPRNNAVARKSTVEACHECCILPQSRAGGARFPEIPAEDHLLILVCSPKNSWWWTWHYDKLW